MAQDYVQHLAASVLNDRRAVTYYSLSRALKIHANVAKKMLYEFHRAQNEKQPGSVHATYLISGRRPANQPVAIEMAPSNGEDVAMTDSSFAQPEEEPTQQSETVIQLVPEEKLEEVRNRFSEVNSLHVYSLAPNAVKYLEVLSDCNRAARQSVEREDPTVSWKQYGIIQNPLATRRTRQNTRSLTEQGRNETSSTHEPSQSSAKPVEPPKLPSNAFGSRSTSKSTHTQKSSTQSSVKRENSLAMSFAKAKPKAAPAPAPKTEDVPMMDADDEDDDDGDDDALIEAGGKSFEEVKKERAAREEALRKMMEDDDEPEESKDEPMDEEAPEPAAPVEPQEEPQPPPSASSQAADKRRGRRRVTKKVVSKDEDGYLVTKEETAWESFSEGEPEPKPKPKAAPAPAAKSKKGGPKTGQGNIMSFFKKQ